jgi:VWFA-related protein
MSRRIARGCTSAMLLAAGVAAGVAAGGAAPGAGPAPQTPAQFRARVDSVWVNVSVKRGNAPVAGLTAADFRLTDNGVEQKIDSVAIESVPIDLTLFLDTSPSFSGRVPRLREDLEAIAGLLRPGEDRLRLLTFGREVDETVPWTVAGEPLRVGPLEVARMSAVYDGLAASLVHQPEPGRRHLIVAMTDGWDYGSVIGSERLLEVAERSDGVLHLVLLTSSVSGSPNAAKYWVPSGPDARGQSRLASAADRTGGRVHVPAFRLDLVGRFQQAFDDFRTSYVLRYTPAGVAREGWHEITVTVPSARGAQVRARRGYSG